MRVKKETQRWVKCDLTLNPLNLYQVSQDQVRQFLDHAAKEHDERVLKVIILNFLNAHLISISLIHAIFLSDPRPSSHPGRDDR